jgi:hypothetical protein
VENCTDFNIHERPPQSGIHYFAFADAAGGTGSDSFALCIAHYDKQRDAIVVDLVREYKPRFVPRTVITELSKLLQAYGIASVMSDNFGAGLTSDEWLRNGVRFLKCARDTSDNYLFALPLLLAGQVRLVDNATLRSQLSSLERHAMAHGEVVRHPAVASAHDDLATAVCGAVVMVQRAAQRPQLKIVQPSVYSNGNWWPNGSAPAGPSPRDIATSPCQPPITGNFRPSRLEPWFGFSGRPRARWPGS